MLISRPPVIAAAAALVCGLAVAIPTQAMAAPSTLMISGYLEGWRDNKAIELYNPTDAPIALSDYSLRLFANGATSPTNTWTGGGRSTTGPRRAFPDRARPGCARAQGQGRHRPRRDQFQR